MTGKHELVKQPDARPTRKVTYSASLGALLVAVLGMLQVMGLEVPAEVKEAAPAAAAFAVWLGQTTAAYFTRERA